MSTPNFQGLTDTLERLCELSRSQLEALDRDDFVSLSKLLDKKDVLLSEVSQFVIEKGSDLSAEQRETIESIQANERYVRRVLSQKTQEISDRMNAMTSRRRAVKSYRDSNNSQSRGRRG
jgi:hypothetical protein